jgi:AAA domain
VDALRDVLDHAEPFVLPASPETAPQEPARPQALRRLTFTRFADVKMPTTSRYLVKGIIPDVGMVVVWGPPKCGKSFFVFDMVAHVAAAWEYRGRRVKQCPVVYFALEGQQGFTGRIEAFRLEHGAADIPFYLSADRIVLPQDGAAVVKSIREEFPDVRPGIVVLDTLNRSIVGSENDPGDMGSYVRAADMIREAFNCVVIIIHHCGVEGSRPRGHTSLTGAADAQLAVKRDPAGNIVTKVEFMKDGPEGDEIVSCLESVTVGTDDDGEAMTSCIVRAAEQSARPTEAKKPRKLTDRQKLAIDALTEVVLSGGKVPPATFGLPQCIKVAETADWHTEMTKRGVIDPVASNPRADFKRLKDGLAARNLIGIRENFVWPASL